jgi:alanyl-tRNA synthetase
MRITPEELRAIENMVNAQIKANLPVTMEEMDTSDALKSGAIGFFTEKYGNRVKVYTIGDQNAPYSKEICGGPHVAFTGVMNHFKIKKEEALGSGIRRIYAEVQS